MASQPNRMNGVLVSQASTLCRDGSPRHRADDPGALGTTITMTPEVAMLAATALGFAVNSGPTDDNVCRLTALAESEPDALMQACAAALQLCVAPDQDRMIAVELLGRAARRCAERGLSSAAGAERGAGSAHRGPG
jgi:hypothetical protein